MSIMHFLKVGEKMKLKIRSKAKQRQKFLFLLMVIGLIMGNMVGFVQAKGEEPPEEPAKEQQVSYTIDTNSAGIAWGDPNGTHSVYNWPFTVVQMGHAIQSFQNYGSTASSSYFHHGIDMIAPDGTDVFTRSGGQVVNIENYNSSDLYWEVAILDPEGYVWQYHHLDKNTIPQLIKDAYAAWKTNPSSGGYVPPNTYIGDIVYWTVTSFGYRFNHIHLNIFGAGDKYLNTMEFHTPLNDTQAPEILSIGLLNGDSLVSGSVASGNYGLYVSARDLFLSTVYYLPPYKTEFSLDGGPWTTVWEFHDLPGGASDTAFVNDFFVYPPTCGNYSCRDFYIDLGFTTEGQRVFPSTPGQHTVDVRVWDYNGNSASGSFSWMIAEPYITYENTTQTSIPDNRCASGIGVTQTFNVTEDMTINDVNLGVNISHTRRGQVRVTLKSPSDVTATTIITNSSVTYDNYDVMVDDASSSNINDGSNDSIYSPYYDRTAGPSTNGSLDAFNGKSSLGTWTVFVCDNTSSTTGTVNRIKLEFTGTPNINNAPAAESQSLIIDEDTPVEVNLSGTDEDGDQLTFIIVDGPSYGSLVSEEDYWIYTPTLNYHGNDSFTFVANDGRVNSDPATVSITVNPVNDPPVIYDQSVTTQANTPIVITLAGEDVDGDTLYFSVLNGPSHGTLSGSISNLVYTPDAGYFGSDSFIFNAYDGVYFSGIGTVNISIEQPSQMVIIFVDDFETDKGWMVNPFGTDTASSGFWERADPEITYYNGVKQQGNTTSGSFDLVTGALAGRDANSYDIDKGVTSIRSPYIELPATGDISLSFSFYLAHLTNASTSDFLRVKVVGDTTALVLEELGSRINDDAFWESYTISLNTFAGQTIYILIEAADGGGVSLVEAAIDDVIIVAQ